MPTKLEEIEAVFNNEFQRWDSTILARAQATHNGREVLTIKGTADPDELLPGLSYRFYGRWTTHPKYGRQFHFQTFTPAKPHGRRGIVTYLQQCKGIGTATASLLYDKFAGDAVRILRESPEVAAAAVLRLTEEVAQAASETLQEMAGLESCSIELIDLIASRGFPKTIVRKAIKAFGNRAAEFITRNPYLLMRFRGVGFLRADAFYLDLGLPAGRIKRQAYCAWHEIASDSDGHTWHPIQKVERAIAGKIASAEVNCPAAVRLAVRAKLLAAKRDENGRLWVAKWEAARDEKFVGEHIRAAMAGRTAGLTAWPNVSELPGLYDHQREQLTKATDGIISILAGSPGTGKTHSAAALIRAVAEEHGLNQMAVCAPTGKAAVRVTEAMQANGIELQARTIHSLLGVEAKEDGAGWSFRHGPMNPFPFRFIICDESSMLDTSLMASFLAARHPSTHLLFIGDVHQLPPVGHGAPLRDMIAAGVPAGELTEIRRNAGAIVQACADIRDHHKFTPESSIDLAAGKNLVHVETAIPAGQIAQVDALLKRLKDGGQVDPVWDAQVIVAVNRKSPLSRATINSHLQDLLNPAGERAKGNPFRVGDKVICLKNGFLPAAKEGSPYANEDGKVFVANGEMGRVLEVAPKLSVVELPGVKPGEVKRVKVLGGGGDQSGGSSGGTSGDSSSGEAGGSDWDLAYAISCHKSQGSEFPIVIIPIDDYPGARMVCSRAWLYTALSRAKKACITIGKLGTALGFCRRDALGKRKTFLRELIGVESPAEEATSHQLEPAEAT